MSGRLSAVGAGPERHPPRQSRRHADGDGGGAWRRGRTHRLHQQRRDASRQRRHPLTDETEPLDEVEAIGAYKRSKVAAERLVETMVRNRGLPAIIVNPSTPIGPRDVKPTRPAGSWSRRPPARSRLRRHRPEPRPCRRWSPRATCWRWSTAGLASATSWAARNVGLREMLSVIAGQVGRKAPTVALPRAPLYPLAWAAEAVARVTGKEPFVTATRSRWPRITCSSPRPKRSGELGYASRPYAGGDRGRPRLVS